MKSDLVIDRPFAIWVDEDPDTKGQWIAHVVGHELDNITWHDSPADAVFMASDMIRILTCQCKIGEKEHDWSIESTRLAHDDTVIQGLTCSKCGLWAANEEFE